MVSFITKYWTESKGDFIQATKNKRKREVRPRFELGLLESEPNVITTYTIGPLHRWCEIVIQQVVIADNPYPKPKSEVSSWKQRNNIIGTIHNTNDVQATINLLFLSASAVHCNSYFDGGANSVVYTNCAGLGAADRININ